MMQSHFWVLLLTVFTPLLLLLLLGSFYFQRSRVTVKVNLTALPSSLREAYVQLRPELEKEVQRLITALDRIPAPQRYELLDALGHSNLIQTVPLSDQDFDTLLWIADGKISWVSEGGAYPVGAVPAFWKKSLTGQASVLIEVGERSVVLFKTPGGYLGLSGLNTPAVQGWTRFWWFLLDLFRSTWGMLLLVVLGTLAFGGFMAHRQSRKIVKPLEELAGVLNAYGAGQFEQRLPEKGPLELRQLIRNVNGIGAQLSSSIHALKTAHQQTREVLERERRLMGNLSHDLRTPLSTLLVHVEALQQDPERLEFLPILQQEAHSIARMIEDVLALHQVQEEAKLDLTLLDPDVLLSAVVSSMKVPAWNAGIVLQSRLEARTSLLLDARKLERVLRNLITNAVRHTPEGGVVEVWSSRAGSEVRIGVTDTGEGILPEHLSHIFERFYRADASRTRNNAERQMGLGLAIAREITESMGGKISVESVPGEGTTFTLEFRV
ncbi:sensor histidine kinase [Deinococcus roseus]|uniref:histidine kinase n=1 Tax=Deinococcus roseus TaxID=392414 RepID=A0ABQ2D8W2_9DEIO|nr:HAMP domain-containing sensor histidine kinase [Deinococcus roseus]GGJ46086.1 hypothetical protein GCM10008938_35390 [Deinococcus roseus]